MLRIARASLSLVQVLLSAHRAKADAHIQTTNTMVQTIAMAMPRNPDTNFATLSSPRSPCCSDFKSNESIARRQQVEFGGNSDSLLEGVGGRSECHRLGNVRGITFTIVPGQCGHARVSVCSSGFEHCFVQPSRRLSQGKAVQRLRFLGALQVDPRVEQPSPVLLEGCPAHGTVRVFSSPCPPASRLAPGPQLTGAFARGSG